MIEEGLKTNIEEAAEQLYNSLTRKAVECSRSVNLRDLDIKLVEENPANIILAFLSRDCGFKTCQKLREQYNIFKNALNRNWNLRTALSVAKSCKSRAELIRKDKSVYGYLERNHPDELNKLFPYKIKYWDLSSALAEGRCYKLRSEFFIKAKGAFAYLDKNHPDELNRLFPAEPRIKWNLRLVLKKVKKEKYESYRALRKGDWSLWQYLEGNPKERLTVLKLLPKARTRVTKQNTIEAMRSCKSRNEFVEKHKARYRFALTNLRKELDKLLPREVRPKWDFGACQKDALKWGTEKEWRDNSSGAYTAARKNDWLNKCCGHMKKVKARNGVLTLEWCERDAQKHQTRGEWRKKSPSAYHKAWANGWLEECCAHMKVLRKRNG